MKAGFSWIITALLLICSFCCEAQVRPFLFTTSPVDASHQKINVHLDAGLGNGSLGFSNAPSVDGRIVVEWNLNSRWMFVGDTAIGKDESHTVVTGQVLAFYALRNNTEGKFRRIGRRWSSLGARWR